MKLKQWLYGAAALAMLAACSDKDIAPGGDPDNGETKFTEGISYLGINIELPSEPISRAEDGDHSNDQFGDGLPKEYVVENAALLLFKGSTEAEAKFIGAYQLSWEENFEGPDKNITTSFKKTIRVLNKPSLNSGESYYGLALVNYDTDHFMISAKDDGTYGNLSVNTPDDPNEIIEIKRIKDGEAAATTFNIFRGYTSNCKFKEDDASGELKHIFMTNAPLSDVQGTSKAPTDANIHTLAELKDYFEPTQAQALDKPAGCIFVERAVAKITCSGFPTTVTLKQSTVEGETVTESDVKLTIDEVSWIVDNEEPTSYIVRNAKEGTDFPFWAYANKGSYRFIGGVGMADKTYDPDNSHKANSTWYRTYWCIDPNYSNNTRPYNDQANPRPSITNSENNIVTPAYEPNFIGLVKGTENVFKSSSAFYPHENTFDVEHQNYKNTTRVVFRVKYAKYNGETKDNSFKLYAIRDQLKTFYLKDDAEKLLKGSVLRSKALLNLIEKYKIDATVTYTEADLAFDFGTATEAEAKANEANHIVEGDYIIKNITFKPSLLGKLKTLTDTEQADFNSSLASIATNANATFHIVPFNDNTCYYAAYIKHFGDTYCPLWDNWKGETTEKVYESNDEMKYLGRYGLVRNNWYDLEISKISNLGKATVPNGNVTTSDDNNVEEWFLSANIHVLSWAKRTQNVEF